MGRLNESLDLKHDVNLFGFVFGKMRVLEWPLSWKLNFSLYGYKFDKYEAWTRPLMWNMIFEPIWC